MRALLSASAVTPTAPAPRVVRYLRRAGRLATLWLAVIVSGWLFTALATGLHPASTWSMLLVLLLRLLAVVVPGALLLYSLLGWWQDRTKR